MSPFIYQDQAFHANWDAQEIVVFAAMIRATIETLQAAASGSGSNANSKIKTNSEIINKLLPPVSKNDEVNDEFSRLMGQQIADAKIQTLIDFGLMLVAGLPDSDEMDITVPVVIPADQAQLALQALTTLRAYLGAKLEIETDSDTELVYGLMEAAYDSEDPVRQQQAFLASVFFAAGFVQETLVEAITSRR